jgi:hypothetical protein
VSTLLGLTFTAACFCGPTRFTASFSASGIEAEAGAGAGRGARRTAEGGGK